MSRLRARCSAVGRERDQRAGEGVLVFSSVIKTKPTTTMDELCMGFRPTRHLEGR